MNNVQYEDKKNHNLFMIIKNSSYASVTMLSGFLIFTFFVREPISRLHMPCIQLHIRKQNGSSLCPLKCPASMHCFTVVLSKSKLAFPSSHSSFWIVSRNSIGALRVNIRSYISGLS